MGKETSIQWCTATWNPWMGCRRVSPGCAYCYADRDMTRYGRDFDKVTRAKDATFYAPLKWKEPKLIFTCSWSDFFIEGAGEWRDNAWHVIRQCPQHIFLILTKRIEQISAKWKPDAMYRERELVVKNYPNVCLMATAENQRQLNSRLPHLFNVPAKWYGLSLEPLLGPIDIEDAVWPLCRATPEVHYEQHGGGMWCEEREIDWVIVGGESGGPQGRQLVQHVDATYKGWRPKPRALQWVQSLRNQCIEAGVPFSFKQWGGPKPTSGGRLLDGREWNQMPPEFEKIVADKQARS